MDPMAGDDTATSATQSQPMPDEPISTSPDDKPRIWAWLKKPVPIFAFLLGALVTQVLNTPRTIDLITNAHLQVSVTLDLSPEQDQPIYIVPDSQFPKGADATNFTKVKTVAQTDGTPIFLTQLGVVLTNDSATAVRVTDISLLPLNQVDSPADGDLVALFPEGGGFFNTLTLWADYDKPQDGFRLVKDVESVALSSKKFFTGSIEIASNSSLPVNFFVRAEHTSGSFEIRFTYSLHGRTKYATTTALGPVSGPRCESRQLAYSRITVLDSGKDGLGAVHSSSPADLSSRLAKAQTSARNYGC